MPVIKDVAKLAGVSTGTVSKYLNNPASLKEDTRRRVEAAIQTLQYKPNPLARSMRTGRSNSLAVLTPDIANPFFAEIYNAIRSSAVQNGYTPILFTTADDLEILRDYLSHMSVRQVDGIILCFLDENETIKSFIQDIQSQIPLVLISWDLQITAFSSVVVDVFEGSYKATAHLTGLGHRDIAYISGPENSKISREKYNGFCKAMQEAGCPVRPAYKFCGGYNLQSGYRAARAFTMLPQAPTAIVAANDILAIGCLKYLLRQKIRIPEEMAVIGFDDISLAAMYEPSLSTIALPIAAIGGEAVKSLLARIAHPFPRRRAHAGKTRQVILKTELIVRNSTDQNAPVEFET